MHWINWAIVVVYLVYVVWDGIRLSKDTDTVAGYFTANKSLAWWVVGLSVMATQLSAVTMIGTTGQGATAGMGFIQIYLGLPLAMVILGVTIVPMLHRSGVYTAYEYLERRFDAKTRTFASLLFLLSRGMSCGTIVAAPAVVFSAIWGIPVSWSVALIGIPTVIYTMVGGVQAVAWTDVKQMVLIVFSLVAVMIVLLVQMPINPHDGLRIAGATGRLAAFDFSFDMSTTYTFWSGMIGGTFLMLSYFGTDQSQVQRFLTAKSVDQARNGLLMSAYWKIPLQALILFIGIGVFLYYQFVRPPLLYNPDHEAAVMAERGEAYAQLEARYDQVFAQREAAALLVADAEDEATEAAAMETFRAREAEAQAVRDEALALAADVTGGNTTDVNYIIPRFVLSELPLGLAGLFIAGVMAAAMSSIAAELNALATASVIDFYQRWWRRDADDAHYLRVSKAATFFWGVFACVVATYAATLGSLIEVVNQFGSFFYGSILGVFLLAMIRRASATGAFVGMIVGMTTVGFVAFGTDVAYLWQNVIGAGVVVAVGLALSRPSEAKAVA
jgi:SSS family solute:Na+ symporter